MPNPSFVLGPREAIEVHAIQGCVAGREQPELLTYGFGDPPLIPGDHHRS
jgi:hypothetical protein